MGLSSSRVSDPDFEPQVAQVDVEEIEHFFNEENKQPERVEQN